MRGTQQNIFVEKRRTLLMMLIPATALLIAVTIPPLAYLFWVSLHKWEFGAAETVFVYLANFGHMIQDGRFWNSVILALVLIGMVVAFQLSLGLLISERLNRAFKGKKVFRMLLLLPMVSPPVVVGVMWRMFLQPRLGIVSYLLGLAGIKTAWLASSRTALLTIAVVDTWQWLPFVILMFMAGLASIPEELSEAARADGANQYQIFRHIFLPLLKPVIIITLLFRVVDTIKIFPKIFIMTEGGPGTSTEIMNFYAFRTTFQYSRFGYGSALSFTVFLICIFLSVTILASTKTR